MSNNLIERIVTKGDISSLSPADKVEYYRQICERLNLDPLSQPFQFLTLSGRQVLYATKSCTEQLRVINGISVTALDHTTVNGVYIVTCKVQNAKGRIDCATGAVAIDGLKGDALANAVMKAETKAKRRATLSIAGLGVLDESEIETIPGATVQTVEQKRLEFDRAEPHTLGAEWGRLDGDTIKKPTASLAASRVELPAVTEKKSTSAGASRAEAAHAHAPIEAGPASIGVGAIAKVMNCEIRRGVAKTTGRAWVQYMIDLLDDDSGRSIDTFTWSETVYRDAEAARASGALVEYQIKPGRTARSELVLLYPTKNKNLPEGLPF